MKNNTSNSAVLVTGFFFGAIAGAVAGLLLAPKSGKETREDLKAQSKDLKEDLEVFSKDLKSQVKVAKKDIQQKIVDTLNTKEEAKDI